MESRAVTPLVSLAMREVAHEGASVIELVVAFMS